MRIHGMIGLTVNGFHEVLDVRSMVQPNTASP